MKISVDKLRPTTIIKAHDLSMLFLDLFLPTLNILTYFLSATYIFYAACLAFSYRGRSGEERGKSYKGQVGVGS